MFGVKAKIYGVLYNQSSSVAFKHLVIGQRQKALNFSDFHWSPHGSLVSIGQHNHESGIFTEKDRDKLNYRIGRRGPNHRIRLDCAGRS